MTKKRCPSRRCKKDPPKVPENINIKDSDSEHARWWKWALYGMNTTITMLVAYHRSGMTPDIQLLEYAHKRIGDLISEIRGE